MVQVGDKVRITTEFEVERISDNYLYAGGGGSFCDPSNPNTPEYRGMKRTIEVIESPIRVGDTLIWQGVFEYKILFIDDRGALGERLSDKFRLYIPTSEQQKYKKKGT